MNPRRAQLRAEGRCIDCRVSGVWQYVRCLECRRAHAKRTKAYCDRRREAKRREARAS